MKENGQIIAQTRVIESSSQQCFTTLSLSSSLSIQKEMLACRPFQTWNQHIVAVNDELCCRGECQAKRPAPLCCVDQQPRQSEPCRMKPPVPDRPFYSDTFLPGSSERLCHGSTPPVHVDHTATGLLVTVWPPATPHWCPLFSPRQTVASQM